MYSNKKLKHSFRRISFLRLKKLRRTFRPNNKEVKLPWLNNLDNIYKWMDQSAYQIHINYYKQQIYLITVKRTMTNKNILLSQTFLYSHLTQLSWIINTHVTITQTRTNHFVMTLFSNVFKNDLSLHCTFYCTVLKVRYTAFHSFVYTHTHTLLVRLPSSWADSLGATYSSVPRDTIT